MFQMLFGGDYVILALTEFDAYEQTSPDGAEIDLKPRAAIRDRHLGSRRDRIAGRAVTQLGRQVAGRKPPLRVECFDCSVGGSNIPGRSVGSIDGSNVSRSPGSSIIGSNIPGGSVVFTGGSKLSPSAERSATGSNIPGFPPARPLVRNSAHRLPARTLPSKRATASPGQTCPLQLLFRWWQSGGK